MYLHLFSDNGTDHLAIILSLRQGIAFLSKQSPTNCSQFSNPEFVYRELLYDNERRVTENNESDF